MLMYQQHFGLKYSPLGKQTPELWDDGPLAQLAERFPWLLNSPGVGLLTGEAGVGKTAALRHLTGSLNPHRYQVVYLAETDFAMELLRQASQGLPRQAGRLLKTAMQLAVPKGLNHLPDELIQQAIEETK